MRIDFDLCPSDCDAADQPQKTLASLVPGKWKITTGRVVHGELKGGGAVMAEAAGPKIELSKDEIKLNTGKSSQFTFEQQAGTDELVPVVSLKARFVDSTLGGSTHGLTMRINGKPLMPDRCINRPEEMTFADGQKFSLFAANSWVVIYSPDYKAIHADTESNYYIPPGKFDAYTFDFDVKGLVKPGRNAVTVQNKADPRADAVLAFENVTVQWVPADQATRHEETGKSRPPVTVRPPRDLVPPADAILDQGGAIRFEAAGQTWTINSQFSQTNGQ